jgi:ABC-type glycerol-3-phosphate transport system permease component
VAAAQARAEVDQRATAVRRPRLAERVQRLALYLLIVVLGAAFFAPFLWTITTSLKRTQELYLFPPVLLPQRGLAYYNYALVFDRIPFALFFRNTAIITIFATLGSVVSTTLVAYGFARQRFPLREPLFIAMLSTMMLPAEVTIIPKFILFKELGWVDTFWPLIVPEFLAINAFYVFLTRQFLMTIPRDFDEAAMVDGASPVRILWSVLLPLMQPAIITVSILSFLAHWGDFFGPLIYLNSKENLTLSLGLRYFASSALNFGDNVEPRDHLLMAASLMAAAPAIALFFIAQRYFVRGIVMTGLKG